MVDSPSHSAEDGSDEIGGVIRELLGRFIQGTSRSPFSKVTPKWKMVLWISTLCIVDIGLNYYRSLEPPEVRRMDFYKSSRFYMV